MQYLTGLDLEAKTVTDGHDTVVEEEIDSLRAQVEELTQEGRSTVLVRYPLFELRISVSALLYERR